MKKILVFVGFLFFIGFVSAQSVFYSENFNNGCTSLCLANTYAGWSISSTGTNGAFANDWYISCAENGQAPGTCGAGCGNDATLHISNVAGSPGGLCPTGDCGAAYDASLASIVTNKRVESPIVSAAGLSNIRLRYDFIAAGTAGTDFYSVLYSPDGGTTWIDLGAGATSVCCCNFLDCFLSVCCAPSTTTCGGLRQGNWTQTTLNLPATADNNPNIRIGFNWTNNGDNAGTDPSVAINNLQLIGDFVLPVQLAELSGRREQESIVLNWQYGATNLDAFDIQKSLDGINFKKIGEIKPNTSRSNPAYSFTDHNSSSGVQYYRLQLIQASGQTEISQVLEISSADERALDFRFYPNPLGENQTLSLHYRTQKYGQLELILYDLQGKEIFKSNWIAKKGEHRKQITLPDLPSGIHILEFRGEGQRFREKLLCP